MELTSIKAKTYATVDDPLDQETENEDGGGLVIAKSSKGRTYANESGCTRL